MERIFAPAIQLLFAAWTVSRSAGRQGRKALQEIAVLTGYQRVVRHGAIIEFVRSSHVGARTRVTECRRWANQTLVQSPSLLNPLI